MATRPDPARMLEELWDREQIRELKYRNLRHLDLKQWDQMAETFAPDATTSWCDGAIRLAGRDAIMGFLKGTDFAKGDLVTHVHQCAAMEISFLTPDRAKTVSRLYNPMFNAVAENRYLLLAFYHDEFERREGEWKITHSGHEYLIEEVHDWRDVPSHRVLSRHAF